MPTQMFGADRQPDTEHPVNLFRTVHLCPGRTNLLPATVAARRDPPYSLVSGR